LILFGEEGCGLGCWQDLRLGMTDAETVQYFQENFSEGYRTFEYEGTVNYTGDIAVDIGRFSVEAYIRDDAIHAILLYTSDGFDLTLEKVIAELGEPPFLYWTFEIPGEIYDVFPYIILYYPEQGYVFYLDIPRQGRTAYTAYNPITICPIPDTRINKVYMVYPDTIETVISDADFLTTSTRSEQIVNGLVSWQGYECQTFEYEIR
jgi:hypothetical protein